MVEPESVFPVDVLPEIKKEINKYVDQLMEKYAESNYNDTKYPSLEDLYKLVRAGKFKGYAYKKSALYGINVIVYEKLKELRDERKDLDQLGRTDPTVQAEGR